MSTLATDLKRLQPGETYTIRQNARGPLRITGLTGRQDAPITIQGAPGLLILGNNSSPFAVRFDDCAWLRFGLLGVEGCWGSEARGVQVFTSEHMELFDLTTRRIWLDHLHSAGSNHVTVRRHRADGAGGRTGRGGEIAGHAIYFTAIDEDCSDLIAEDCEAKNMLGACFQWNGDGQTLHGAVARRMRGIDYGQVGGAGFNLAQCAGPVLEDITLQTRYQAGGVRSYDGTTGTTLTRYAISVSPPWEGPMRAVPGTPAPPQFDVAPQPAPQPPEPSATAPDQLQAELRTAIARAESAEAQLAQVREWFGQAPAGLRG